MTSAPAKFIALLTVLTICGTCGLICCLTISSTRALRLRSSGPAGRAK